MRKGLRGAMAGSSRQPGKLASELPESRRPAWKRNQTEEKLLFHWVSASVYSSSGPALFPSSKHSCNKGSHSQNPTPRRAGKQNPRQDQSQEGHGQLA